MTDPAGFDFNQNFIILRYGNIFFNQLKRRARSADLDSFHHWHMIFLVQNLVNYFLNEDKEKTL